jgi:hypothetical protein
MVDKSRPVVGKRRVGALALTLNVSRGAITKKLIERAGALWAANAEVILALVCRVEPPRPGGELGHMANPAYGCVDATRKNKPQAILISEPVKLIVSLLRPCPPGTSFRPPRCIVECQRQFVTAHRMIGAAEESLSHP